MTISISKAVGEVKKDIQKRLPARQIELACRECGHSWRQRILGPVATVYLFVLQILHHNTACNHLRHLTGGRFTGTAYCQARKRLPLRVLQVLLRKMVLAFMGGVSETGLWHGHRLWLVDGSSFSMSDTPELQNHFGQPGAQAPGCGFPKATTLAMFAAPSGLLIDVLVRPLRSHDMSGIAGLHHHLRSGDVLLADRGFASYAHLALLYKRGVHAVFRMHQRQIVSFRKGRKHAKRSKKSRRKGMPTSRFIRKLGPLDQVVEYVKPQCRPRWMDAKTYASLPDSIVVRELRYTIELRGSRTQRVTLVTTLLDADRYPASELKALYKCRWQVETNLGHLKTTMGMDVLHTKTVEGVLKEVTMFALAYNLVRMVMLEAAREETVDLDRVSFIDAMRWLASSRTRGRPLGLVMNPSRPDRLEPRVRKRRPKEYPLMKKPRDELRQALVLQRDKR